MFKGTISAVLLNLSKKPISKSYKFDKKIKKWRFTGVLHGKKFKRAVIPF